MRRTENTSRGGNALIEFTLLGIPLLFVTISIAAVSLDMWEYHNLAFVTEATSRYITMHGATCLQGTNNCTITVSNIVTFFEGQALALNPNQVIVQLTDAGNNTTTCNPVSNCASTNTQFPSNTYNGVGSDVTVSATYVLKNPFAVFWPPDRDPPHDFTVGAKSRQRIVF